MKKKWGRPHLSFVSQAAKKTDKLGILTSILGLFLFFNELGLLFKKNLKSSF